MKLLVLAITLPAIISAAMYDNTRHETYDSRRPALSNRRQDFHLPAPKDQYHTHGSGPKDQHHSHQRGQNPHHHGPTDRYDANRRGPGDQYDPHPHHPVPHQSGGLRGSSHTAKPLNSRGRYSGLFPRPIADSYQPGYAQPNPDRHRTGYTGPRPDRHQSGYGRGDYQSRNTGSDRNRNVRPHKLISRLSRLPTHKPTYPRGTSGRRY